MTEIILNEEAFDEVRGKFVDAELADHNDWYLPFTVGDITFKLGGEQWGPKQIGAMIKIRLPKDYKVSTD